MMQTLPDFREIIFALERKTGLRAYQIAMRIDVPASTFNTWKNSNVDPLFSNGVRLLDHHDAADCCFPHISETWVCASCGSENFDDTEADACCPPEDPQSPEACRLRVAQLEAAGQLWFKGF